MRVIPSRLLYGFFLFFIFFLPGKTHTHTPGREGPGTSNKRHLHKAPELSFIHLSLTVILQATAADSMRSMVSNGTPAFPAGGDLKKKKKNGKEAEETPGIEPAGLVDTLAGDKGVVVVAARKWSLDFVLFSFFFLIFTQYMYERRSENSGVLHHIFPVTVKLPLVIIIAFFPSLSTACTDMQNGRGLTGHGGRSTPPRSICQGCIVEDRERNDNKKKSYIHTSTTYDHPGVRLKKRELGGCKIGTG